MIYIELKDKISKEIEEILIRNKKLYDNKIEDITKYNLDLMQHKQIKSDFISSTITFEHALRRMNELVEIGKMHQVSKIQIFDFEADSEDSVLSSVDITYTATRYYPSKSIKDFNEYHQRRIFKKFFAEAIGLYHYQMDCKLLELYKEGILSLEQLKASHKIGCWGDRLQ